MPDRPRPLPRPHRRVPSSHGLLESVLGIYPSATPKSRPGRSTADVLVDRLTRRFSRRSSAPPVRNGTPPRPVERTRRRELSDERVYAAMPLPPVPVAETEGEGEWEEAREIAEWAWELYSPVVAVGRAPRILVTDVEEEAGRGVSRVKGVGVMEAGFIDAVEEKRRLGVLLQDDEVVEEEEEEEEEYEFFSDSGYGDIDDLPESLDYLDDLQDCDIEAILASGRRCSGSFGLGFYECTKGRT